MYGSESHQCIDTVLNCLHHLSCRMGISLVSEYILVFLAWQENVFTQVCACLMYFFIGVT